jgi:hypothetical protein
MDREQNVASNEMVLMIQSADHITGLTGATLTITASKNCGAFSSVTPTVTERGNGWYELALTSSHTDTLGNLVLHITATSADPTDLKFQIVTPKLPTSLYSAAPSAATIGSQVRTELTYELGLVSTHLV